MRVFEAPYLGTDHLVQWIAIEQASDAAQLLKNIIDTGYYDSGYFKTHSGYEPGKIVPNFWFIAEIARALKPRSAFEVGCGRGDVLKLLARSGVRVAGADFSADVVSEAWPDVRQQLEHGELAEVCERRAKAGKRCDLLLGFDIWEHLLPSALDHAISAAVSTLTDDGLAYFVVPAFGNDDVFGEPFPLELEQNRAAFEARELFPYLRAERVDPPIPVSGHLIWAHTEWWERAFVKHGLVRVRELEREFHRFFDPIIPASNRCFYVFRRDTAVAEERVRALRGTYTAARFAKCLAGFLHATAVTKELRGGFIKPLVAQYTPDRVRAAYRALRDTVRR